MSTVSIYKHNTKGGEYEVTGRVCTKIDGKWIDYISYKPIVPNGHREHYARSVFDFNDSFSLIEGKEADNVLLRTSQLTVLKPSDGSPYLTPEELSEILDRLNKVEFDSVHKLHTFLKEYTGYLFLQSLVADTAHEISQVTDTDMTTFFFKKEDTIACLDYKAIWLYCRGLELDNFNIYTCATFTEAYQLMESKR